MIAPFILSVAALLIMLQIAFWRHTFTTWLLSCVSVVAAILALVPRIINHQADTLAQHVTPILISDQFSVFFSVLILFASLVTMVMAKDYLDTRRGENEEFYLLVLLSTLGGLILVSATHLATFLLGLELLGVALYALIAYPERGDLPLEAAVKYLILSGAASAILLFGFALIYAALGTLSFAEIGGKLDSIVSADRQLLIMAGTAMVFTGIGFKLSLVPFHMWTPDVYHGAPAPVTGFLATVSKAAIFAALMRLFISANLFEQQTLMLGLSLVAIASMLVGNLLALQQSNLKRLLAYSSIAHLGYLLVTLIVYGSLQQPQLALEAAGFYLAAYVITSLAAFSLLSVISNLEVAGQEGQDRDQISDVQGLFWQHPLLALLFTIALLSLAGIPLTAGFVGKFYLFSAGIQGALWVLVAALVIGSGIGIYYYLKIIFAMTAKPEDSGSAPAINVGGFSLPAKFVICLLIGFMLYLGVFPQPLIEYLSAIQL